MDQLLLTLRQRKLLYYMMNHKTWTTGKLLARELGVTDRTIRSDVAQINRYIQPFQAEILSQRSKGYLFRAEDDEKIHELNRIELGLLTKEERIRYLAFRLCLAEEPIHIIDLEEEMFSSRTTLEQDLKALKQKYVREKPFIKLQQKNNELSFEQNEKKIRELMTRLVHDDWNYSKRGNAYYGYHFLEEENLNYIMDQIPICLNQYGIFLEDPALVYLDLMIAIAYQRLLDGHALQDLSESGKEAGVTEGIKAQAEEGEPDVTEACREIFEVLEEHFAFRFPEAEKKAVYQQICSTRLPDIANINTGTVTEYVEPDMIRVTDRYLEKIREVFGIDLSGDADFYGTLCLTVETFQNDSIIYNTQGNIVFAKDRMMEEFEIAVLFQEIAMETSGRFLTEIELLNLSHCISGGLIYLFQSHPELKIRTVICTHRNLMSLWHMKRILLSQFNTYLEIVGLIPVNAHTSFDFQDTDLILTTDDRVVTDCPGPETIHVSYFITQQDFANISAFITRKRFEHLCPGLPDRPLQLLREASWHERERCRSWQEVLRILAADFDDQGMSGNILEDVTDREEITSFVSGRSVAFVHTLLPVKNTKLSIMTLDHRIMWNNQKIRIVILGAFAPEEYTELFRLKHLFYDPDRESMRMLKTKEEVYSFFRERC